MGLVEPSDQYEVSGGPSSVILVIEDLCLSNRVDCNRVLHPEDSTSWEQLTAIKSNILKRDAAPSAPAGLRVCCVKFIQRIVQVYTPHHDPTVRGRSMLDSVEMYSPDVAQHAASREPSVDLLEIPHALMEPKTLSAEGSGLLDRMLGIFEDTNSSRYKSLPDSKR